jgi:hypothetical protein
VPLVYLFYPETAGRTLEDIDRYFMEHDNIFVFKDKVSELTVPRSSNADMISRSRRPRNVLRSTSRTRRTRCAVIAVSIHELLRWRGTGIACLSMIRVIMSMPKRRRRIKRKCSHGTVITSCSVALFA